MKKILIITILLSTVLLPAVAETNYESPNRPDWFEFCPAQYEHPPVYDNNSYFVYMKRAVQQDGNYWRQRKDNFERFLSECDSRDGQVREACYVRLRTREQSLSQQWRSAVDVESPKTTASMAELCRQPTATLSSTADRGTLSLNSLHYLQFRWAKVLL